MRVTPRSSACELESGARFFSQRGLSLSPPASRPASSNDGSDRMSSFAHPGASAFESYRGGGV